jgi:carboxypeptidase PM20D1
MLRFFTAGLLAAIAARKRWRRYPDEHAQKTLEIYRTIVEVDTSKTKGNTQRVARYLADELLAAGFAEDDVRIVPKGDFATLIATYRGDGSSGKKPILLLGAHGRGRGSGRGLGASAVHPDPG